MGDVCKHDYPSDGCWVDLDCGERSCVGASVCPCGASCLVPDSPGRCEPAGGCCTSDGECGDGGARRCVEGVCQGSVAAPSCWQDSDCGPNEECLGSLVCACGRACYTTEHPGACGCCASAGDCGDTYALTCAGGRCLDRLIASGCWHDAMCPPGQTCEGEQVCACGATCLVPDAPGTCQ
ncbi:MAG: hypothetical protein IT376_19965 [Polyangiaceae bacterium]|nr:hypothetical protein [Polyangiaceae bacterium]